MTWLIVILIIILITMISLQSINNQNLKKSVSGFELLLEKFIEVNQSFYESQKNLVTKEKEIVDIIVKQSSELSILRRYSTQINNSIRLLNDSMTSLKDSEKEIKISSADIKSNKDIINALSTVSNNLKILEKLSSNLKQSIDILKRSK